MSFLNNNVQTNVHEPTINNNGSNLITDQVRVLLFGESSSTGRSLIFDSFSIENLPQDISDVPTSINVHKLTDMVFGTLTLKCQETYFRVHSLSSPNRIMFSQVFSLPNPNKMKSCASHPGLETNLKVDHMKVLYLEAEDYGSELQDSSLSLELENSRTQLGSQQHYDSYNVPNTSQTTIDSGYSESSFCSFLISNKSSFNSISGTSLSHEQSKISRVQSSRTFLTNPTFGKSDNDTNLSTKTSSTVGLAIILAIAADMEEYYKCHTKHIALIESIVFRIRQHIEFAFYKPGLLLSMMIQMSHQSAQWFVRIFPYLQDSPYDIDKRCNTYWKKMYKHSWKKIYDHPTKVTSSMFKMDKFRGSVLYEAIFTTKYKRRRKRILSDTSKSDNYYNEFCQLLGKLENKETNFFISNITTATLTYHLGWIKTCFSSSATRDDFLLHQNTGSYDSLWRQIMELYGAHGWPIKSVQTIIKGSNQKEIISKVLHFIQYFVRYSRVVYNYFQRINVNEDNKNVDIICLNNKFYGNHMPKSSKQKCSHTEKIKALTKSKVCFTNLSDLTTNEQELEEESLLSQKLKPVTFLLGENEELINIKENPHGKYGKPMDNVNNNTILKNSCDVILDRNMEKKSNINHSRSYSVFDNYIHETTKERQAIANYPPFRSNDKRSKSEPRQILKQCVTFDVTAESYRELKKLKLDTEVTENRKPLFSLTSTTNFFDFSEEKYNDRLCMKKKQNTFNNITQMKIFCFPLPRFELKDIFKISCASSLKSDVVGQYIPDMAIQGTSIPGKEWIIKLKKDLYLTRQLYLFNGYVDESIGVVGNTDKWDVEIISSRVRINQNIPGYKLDVSSLVENMLEVLLQMWNLNMGKTHSTTHIEQRLLEICIRSCTLSQFLLHTEMCTMDLLRTVLHLEINDVPLLMSVASIIAPAVSRKYGLSFQ